MLRLGRGPFLTSGGVFSILEQIGNIHGLTVCHQSGFRPHKPSARSCRGGFQTRPSISHVESRRPDTTPPGFPCMASFPKIRVPRESCISTKSDFAPRHLCRGKMPQNVAQKQRAGLKPAPTTLLLRHRLTGPCRIAEIPAPAPPGPRIRACPRHQPRLPPPRLPPPPSPPRPRQTPRRHHPEHRRRARADRGRVQAHPLHHGPRAEPDRARHLLGHVDRALLLQILARLAEEAADQRRPG